jgi:adenosylcobinamide-phosphate synthase
LLVDRALGEPPTPLHPVAWFGTLMGRVEKQTYADRRAAGTVYAAGGTLVGIAVGRAFGSTARHVALAASGRMLRGTARDVSRLLLTGDLAADARCASAPPLVGPSTRRLLD